MTGRSFRVALLFTLASGVYWWFVSQLLPFTVPMMLNDEPMLVRMLVLTGGALIMYVLVALLFFNWLLRRDKP